MVKKAQEWLDATFQNKNVSKIGLYNEKKQGAEELSSDLLVKDYSKVEEIDFKRWDKSKKVKDKITKVTISNCPQVKKIRFDDNEIIEIIFQGSFPNLNQLDLPGNKLTKIDVNEFPNLTSLNVTRNPSLTEIKGLENLTKIETVNFIDTPLKNWESKKWREAINSALGLVSKNGLLPDGWEDKLKELKNTEDKYKDYINPNDKAKLEQAAKGAGFIDPKDSNALEKVVNGQGKTLVDQAAFNNLKNNQEKHTPDQLEKHTAADLKPVDLPVNWKSELARIPGLEINKKPTDYDAIKNELERWRKLGKTPEEVQSKIATGGSGTGSAEQQRKLDLLEKQKKWLLEFIEEDKSVNQYAQILQDFNKI